MTVWNSDISDIIPAIVVFKSEKGGIVWVTFELRCNPSVEELAKYHKLTVLKVISHRTCAQKAQLPTVRRPCMANMRTKLVLLHDHYINYA